MPEPTLLDLAHEHLGWPGRDDIFLPKGAGPKVIAEAADSKIGSQIRRLPDGADARVGILAANPYGNATEAPLALVCQFSRPARQETLLQLQRLAWNFAWARHLIVVEPQLIRSFTCCRPPGGEELSDYEVTPQIQTSQLSLSDQAAQALHWVNLISGEYVRENSARFARDGRVDSTLLANLSCARERLMERDPRLDEDICHDLLARVVFIQFLIDRKDSDGKPALDATRLTEICGHGTLGEALRHKVSAYKLFEFMNKKFNGDLFAGGADEPSQESRGTLDGERAKVKDSHLGLLADLVEGKLAMAKGQQWCLWRQYSFDVVPLAFISSIYEEFVTKRQRKEKGAHYTRPHLVDFMLDGVLPWHGAAWDLRILDPACGSGIFLVKAFQRLVYRWKAAHEGQSINPDQLKNLLERNLFGIDSNSHAVRVASFSLYLAMCEEIEPKSLWEQVRFPALRGKRIVCADFFEEDRPGFRTVEDAESYDIVIGNPPWGHDTSTEAADRWASRNLLKTQKIPHKNLGYLFPVKATTLLKETGTLSMIMPAQAFLTNRSGPAVRFRQWFFERYKVDEIVNLSEFRFVLFQDSDAPPCIVTCRPIPPDGEPLTYICPKLTRFVQDDYLIAIEPQDVQSIYPHEAANNPEIWSILMWGGRRDLQLVRRLHEFGSLSKLCSEGRLSKRKGISKPGKDPVEHKDLQGRKALFQPEFPQGTLLHLDPSELPKIDSPRAHRKTDLSAFNVPQLILKLSWVSRERRFRASMVTDRRFGGVVVSESYVSVSCPEELQNHLECACLSYNSALAVYYLFLTSGQCSGYLPTVLVEDALSVPIPEHREGLLNGLRSLEDVDSRVREAFGFSDVEWALIKDLVESAIPYFRSKQSAHNGKRSADNIVRETRSYCDFFRRVLKAGFGADKRISFTIFIRAKGADSFPVRLVAVHFDSPLDDSIQVEFMDNAPLLTRLQKVYSDLMTSSPTANAGIAYRRVVRGYDTVSMAGVLVPTAYIIKPNEGRYWTRSIALRDADEVAADIMSWQGSSSPTSFVNGVQA